MRFRRALLRDRESYAALATYLITSFLYFGLRLLLEPGRQYVGVDRDQKVYIWDFAWWPHAVLNGENPFVSHAIWAPDGINVGWTVGGGGLALPLAPLTLIAGPFATFNVAAVLAPALSAWTGFLLCRYLTRKLWPSLAGGYLFGFSTFELAHQSAGHIPVSFVALLPLTVLVALRFLNRELSGRALVVRLGPLLALELYLNQEASFTLALAIVVTFALGAALVPTSRERLAALVPYVLGSYGLAAILAAPYVYYLLTGFRGGGYNVQDVYNTDLLNFVVPTRFTLIAGGPASRALPDITLGEEAYLGIPALLGVACFAVRGIRTPSGRFLLASLLVAFVASLGTRLDVSGHQVATMPWVLVHNLPLFNNVLTVRLAVYTSLIVAILLAVWAARSPGVLSLSVLALSVLAIVPNSAGDVWATSYFVPPFFTKGEYRDCLDRGETILPLPIGQGDAMLWQAADGFRFNIAGGYTGAYIPASFLTPGHAYITKGYHLGARNAGIVGGFVAEKHVTTAVVLGYEYDFFAGALNRVASPQRVGGVVLYHFSKTPPSCLGA